MVASTAWTIAGVDVRTLAFDIRTTDGWDLFPGKRGVDLVVPFHHGAVSVPKKFYRPRQLGLGMTILPFDAATGRVTHAEGALGHMRDNMDTLMGLLHSDSLIPVVRTEPDTPGPGTTDREALCEVIATIPLQRGPGLSRRFGIIFEAPDPFWRALPFQTVTATPFTNNGNAPINDKIITMTGGATPRLTHNPSGAYIEVNDAVMANPAVIDVGLRSIVQNSLNIDNLLVRPLDHTEWMEFQPGANALVLTGGGTFSIDAYDKYL